MSDYPQRSAPPVSGWAVGGLTFAGCMLTLIGCFQVIAGLTAIFDDDFFVVTRNYTFDLDTTAWGWIHLILGILLLLVAFGLFARNAAAVGAAIGLVLLSAIANFFFIPYYPLWSIVVIALDVWVLWALTRSGITDR
jgi:hypothetical protein